MIVVECYARDRAAEWDAFVDASKNGTFLLSRRYMDYHAERFADHSLVLRNERGRAVALLPAHATDGGLVSHGGLTYGGLVIDGTMTTPMMLDAVGALVEYLETERLGGLIYKTIPYIYHTVPAEEDRYALFRHGAVLVRRDVLSVVDAREQLPWQGRRRRGRRRAADAGLEVRETADFDAFWAILASNLGDRFGVAPVHTLDEIVQLRGLFPTSIRLMAAYDGEAMLAGIVLYLSQNVCHMQYISASAEGRRCGAIDLIVEAVIDQHLGPRRYVDFGISNEEAGRVLNVGLIEQKEGFGARAVIHDHYLLSGSPA